MSRKISFPNALQIAIADVQKPLISKFEIFSLAFKISKNLSYQGQSVIKQRSPFGINKNYNLIGSLLDKRFLSPDIDFKSYYRIIDEDKGTCEEVCCLVDPFCYVSHLSAMQKYGLTDRIPEVVILTTANIEQWNKMKAHYEMQYYQDILEEEEYSSIRMKRTIFPKVVRKMKTKAVESSLLHPSCSIKDSYARISEIGYTFLDMLANPKLCGGMAHVIDVWKEHAEIYLEEIVEAVDSQPKGIIKVRAGYIIDEILKIKDRRINKWLEFSQRGGSRLLDPNSPYMPKFSEKWMISINV